MKLCKLLCVYFFLLELCVWDQGCLVLCVQLKLVQPCFSSLPLRGGGRGGHIFLLFTAQPAGIFSMHLWINTPALLGEEGDAAPCRLFPSHPPCVAKSKMSPPPLFILVNHSASASRVYRSMCWQRNWLESVYRRNLICFKQGETSSVSHHVELQAKRRLLCCVPQSWCFTLWPWPLCWNEQQGKNNFLLRQKI